MAGGYNVGLKLLLRQGYVLCRIWFWQRNFVVTSFGFVVEDWLWQRFHLLFFCGLIGLVVVSGCLCRS